MKKRVSKQNKGEFSFTKDEMYYRSKKDEMYYKSEILRQHMFDAAINVGLSGLAIREREVEYSNICRQALVEYTKLLNLAKRLENEKKNDDVLKQFRQDFQERVETYKSLADYVYSEDDEPDVDESEWF